MTMERKEVGKMGKEERNLKLTNAQRRITKDRELLLSGVSRTRK